MNNDEAMSMQEFIDHMGLSAELAATVEWCDLCDEWSWDDNGYPTCHCA